jgi:glutamate-5-semialdehyde dehydrogenase
LEFQHKLVKLSLTVKPDGKSLTAADMDAAVLEANARDIEAMPASSPMLDRLRLTPERIGSIASDMEAVSHLRSPQGEELARWTRPNGMTIVKRRVPFGVVGMICEARPNVTADIFSLSIKTGNACVLKGGSDARRSNEAIAALRNAVYACELPGCKRLT